RRVTYRQEGFARGRLRVTFSLNLHHLAKYGQRWGVRNGGVFQQIMIQPGLQRLKRQLPEGTVRDNDELTFAAERAGRGAEEKVIHRPSRFLKSQVTRRQLPAKRLGLFRQVLLCSADRKYCQSRLLPTLRRSGAGFARDTRAGVPWLVA